MNLSKYTVLGEEIIRIVRTSDIPLKEKVLILDNLYRGKILRPRATSDFASFCEYVGKDEKKKSSITNLPAYIELQDFHKEWCEALTCLHNVPETLEYLDTDTATRIQKYKRLNILCPSETGKTWLFTILHTLFRLGRDPDLRFGLVSDSQGQAKRSLYSIKQVLNYDEDIQALFPELKPMLVKGSQQKEEWSVEAIKVDRINRAAKDSTIVSCGIRSQTITGSRYDYLLLDDILRYDVNMSESELRKGIDWFNNTAEKRLVANGVLIAVNTAWSRLDLAHYLANLEGVVTLKYSFEPDDAMEGVRYIEWGTRHPRERLEREKRTDIVAYNRNRRSLAASPEEQVFGQYIDQIYRQDWKLSDVQDWHKFIGMDLATVRRRGTGIVVVAVSPDGQMKIVLDIVLGQWTGPEKKQKIREYYDLYMPQVFMVENNSQQQDIVEFFIEDSVDIPIESYTTKGTKHGILESMAMEMRRGLWRFNLSDTGVDYLESGNSSSTDDSWVIFLSQVKNYIGEAQPPDMLMAWMFASEASKRAHMGSLIHIFDSKTGEEDRLTYSFEHYSLHNELSAQYGFVAKDEYVPITRFIKQHPDMDVERLPFDPEDARSVYEDMVRYVTIMNG